MTLHATIRAGFQIRGLPVAAARALRAGGPDAYGRPAERMASAGGAPCRCCMTQQPAGAAVLLAAHRPFSTIQPYAEAGPIFLCAQACAPWSGEGLPPMFLGWETLIVRGYDADERIVYGTGRVVATADLADAIGRTLADPRVVRADLRSASNNCWLARAERA